MLGVLWTLLKSIYTAELRLTAPFDFAKDLVALYVEDVC